jgi:hypothetical protein
LGIFNHNIDCSDIDNGGFVFIAGDSLEESCLQINNKCIRIKGTFPALIIGYKCQASSIPGDLRLLGYKVVFREVGESFHIAAIRFHSADITE